MLDEYEGKSKEEVDELRDKKEAESHATVLEIVR